MLSKLAQITPQLPGGGSYDLPGSTGGVYIQTPIVNVINWGIAIAGGVAVLVLIISGIMYVTASGNEHTLERAKTGIKGAITGIIIILLAAIIVNTINYALTAGGRTSGRTFNGDNSGTGPGSYTRPQF